jgi:hypothetical protein
MDRVKRNAEIVALVKAREMPMRKIAERYRLELSARITETFRGLLMPLSAIRGSLISLSDRHSEG